VAAIATHDPLAPADVRHRLRAGVRT
jgi:hypothetical protein